MSAYNSGYYNRAAHVPALGSAAAAYAAMRFPRPGNVLKTQAGWRSRKEKDTETNDGIHEAVNKVAVLSGCGKGYLEALADPFRAPAGVCLPADVLPLPTQHVKCVSRGTFTAGNDGNLVIAVYPVPANNAVVMNLSAVATAIIDSTTITNALVGPRPFYMSQLPFEIANISAGGALGTVQYRTCGFGFRFWWIGDQNNCAGMVSMIEEPSHGALGALQVAELQQSANTCTAPMIPGESYGVYWSGPKVSSELAFGVSTTPNNFMTCVVRNGFINAQYGYEIVHHLEYVGPGAMVPKMNLQGPLDFTVPNFLANVVSGTNGPTSSQRKSDARLHAAAYGSSHSVSGGDFGAPKRRRY